MLHDASEAKRLVGIESPVHAGVRTGISSKKLREMTKNGEKSKKVRHENWD